jgi:hypothetical protein
MAKASSLLINKGTQEAVTELILFAVPKIELIIFCISSN